MDGGNVPAGALNVSFATGSGEVTGAVAGAGSAGFVGVGVVVSVLVGCGMEESVSVG
jgi:hypothetical protein